MASSYSSSASFYVHDSRRELTLKHDSMAAYVSLAPLHWGLEEWDFMVASEDEASLTDGQDLQLLLDEDLEEAEDGQFF